VFKNRVARGIFGCKKEALTGSIMRSCTIYNVFYYYCGQIKVEEMRNAHKMLVGKPEG
jgi:hypothetical protein